MALPFVLGLIGSLILVIGAAYPVEKTKIPTKSVKNWLFGIWWLIMLLYAVIWYLNGWPVFFVFLEILILIASILMMLNTKDRFDMSVIGVSGMILIIRSLSLFEWYSTIIFIVGLASLALWYAFKMNTLRRDLALMVWGFLIAIFSYLEASRIFFWLNAFFTLFSLYYTIKFIRWSKEALSKKISK